MYMRTSEDIKAKYPNKDIIEFCIKCKKLYKVPDFLLDILMPICPPCYRQWGSISHDTVCEPKDSNTHKEEYQSNSLPCEQSSSC